MKEIVKGLFSYTEIIRDDNGNVIEVPRFWHDCKAPSRLPGSIKGRVELEKTDTGYACQFCDYEFKAS